MFICKTCVSYQKVTYIYENNIHMYNITVTVFQAGSLQRWIIIADAK